MRAVLVAVVLLLLSCKTPLDVFIPGAPGVVDCLPEFCMSREIWQRLGSEWSPGAVEVYYCLEGDRASRTVTRLHRPAQTGYRTIVYPGPCTARAWGNFHTHPSGGCVLNAGDARHFAFYPEHVLQLVGCGVNKFGYHVRGDPFDYVELWPDSIVRSYGQRLTHGSDGKETRTR